MIPVLRPGSLRKADRPPLARGSGRSDRWSAPVRGARQLNRFLIPSEILSKTLFFFGWVFRRRAPAGAAGVRFEVAAGGAVVAFGVGTPKIVAVEVGVGV